MMLATVNRIGFNVISTGDLFHKAALASQAIIDAIPEDADVREEADVIEAAIATVDELAHLILRTQAAGAIRLRALAWLDGCYWATAEGRA
ncbi:hypothetical protein [Bradyrhizobium sp. AZCC 1708]|uniref:hypothetical protein n=1 Tax=Bradyrhizobium sp. AZCC 1708 TaxID=3117015 RepID=UPI002FF2467A